MVASVVTGNSDVKSHASTFSTGEIGLVLLNYSDTVQDVAISYDGASSNDTVYWYSVHADNQDIGNKKFYVNNITGSTIGGGPDNIDEVNPFMAILDDSSYLSLPKYSTNYFVIKKNDPVLEVGNIQKINNLLTLFPNPTNQHLIIEGSKEELKDIHWFDVNGKELSSFVKTTIITPSKITFDLSRLPVGIYILKTKTKTNKVYKK
jgi:hypothetical protein